MEESDFKQDISIYVPKTHEEILKMLDEIKDFEKKYQEYDLKKLKKLKNLLKLKEI